MYEMNRHGHILDWYNVPNKGQIYFNQAFETFDGKLYLLNYMGDNVYFFDPFVGKKLIKLECVYHNRYTDRYD